MENRVCKNQKVKNGFKAAASVAGTVACVVVTVVTAGKVKPKN